MRRKKAIELILLAIIILFCTCNRKVQSQGVWYNMSPGFLKPQCLYGYRWMLVVDNPNLPTMIDIEQSYEIVGKGDNAKRLPVRCR